MFYFCVSSLILPSSSLCILKFPSPPPSYLNPGPGVPNNRASGEILLQHVHQLPAADLRGKGGLREKQQTSRSDSATSLTIAQSSSLSSISFLVLSIPRTLSLFLSCSKYSRSSLKYSQEKGAFSPEESCLGCQSLQTLAQCRESPAVYSQ